MKFTLCALLLALSVSSTSAEDLILLKNGRELRGTARNIRSMALTFEQAGEKSSTIPIAQVAEVIFDYTDIITLSAPEAELHGGIVYNPKKRRLYKWSKPNSGANWKFYASRKETYTVMLEYACKNLAAGSKYYVRCNGQTIDDKVVGTHTDHWENYITKTMGTINLGVGDHELQIRSRNIIGGGVMDVRRIMLVPEDKGK